jgi:hypothetical protein
MKNRCGAVFVPSLFFLKKKKREGTKTAPHLRLFFVERFCGKNPCCTGFLSQKKKINSATPHAVLHCLFFFLWCLDLFFYFGFFSPRSSWAVFYYIYARARTHTCTYTHTRTHIHTHTRTPTRTHTTHTHTTHTHTTTTSLLSRKTYTNTKIYKFSNALVDMLIFLCISTRRKKNPLC